MKRFIDFFKNIFMNPKEELSSDNLENTFSNTESSVSLLEDTNSSSEVQDKSESEDFISFLDIIDEIEYDTANSETVDEYLENSIEEELFLSNSDIDENFINRIRLQKFREEKSKKFLRILREEEFEYGYESEGERFVRKLFNINELATKSWLNDLFIDHFGEPNILIGILRVISRFEQFEISPVGETIALASLRHKNIEVIECGIRVFENWESTDNLEILENLEVKESWLKNYLNKVIEDIKSDYVLRSPQDQ